jgi:hypothetical protein
LILYSYFSFSYPWAGSTAHWSGDWQAGKGKFCGH